MHRDKFVDFDKLYQMNQHSFQYIYNKLEDNDEEICFLEKNKCDIFLLLKFHCHYTITQKNGSFLFSLLLNTYFT